MEKMTESRALRVPREVRVEKMTESSSGEDRCSVDPPTKKISKKKMEVALIG